MAESTPWRTAISAPCPASSPQAMQTYRPQATRLSGRALVRAETAWILSIAQGLRATSVPAEGKRKKARGRTRGSALCAPGCHPGENRRTRSCMSKPPHRLSMAASVRDASAGTAQGAAQPPGSCRILAALWPQASAGHSRRSPTAKP